ncbi:putative ethylene response sensor 2 [Frankliniella fusca]|uniref:Ethylene response sensor 2 n=1 Tax=Frankliniella fusca TaxID=407009 RepID=A0AAE1GWZ1_9NEOP|nr:putative ethylene response sensor 2 [Frankliniella fusca]
MGFKVDEAGPARLAGRGTRPDPTSQARDPNCHPLVADGLAVLRLDLTEKFECGITKVTNTITVSSEAGIGIGGGGGGEAGE